MSVALSADDVIRWLDLAPHPEGGFYREIFRDRDTVPGTDRAHSTAIYFLLRAGEISRWHRVDAVEGWHFHAGAPLALDIHDGTHGNTHRLGMNLAAGERPQAIVPNGAWQRARSLGPWTLVGCTVSPGFEFRGFELADEGFDPMPLDVSP